MGLDIENYFTDLKIHGSFPTKCLLLAQGILDSIANVGGLKHQTSDKFEILRLLKIKRQIRCEINIFLSL